MARETLNIENRDSGRYFVEVQATVPDVRRREKLVTGDVFAAIDQLTEFCRELGLGGQSNKPLPRPALQADIDRAQAAQEAAGDVARAKEWRDGSLNALNAGVEPGAVEWIDPAELENRQALVFKRGPGRPRKEA